MVRVLYRIAAIVFALSVIGNLTIGKIFFAGIVIAIFFAYLGWRPIRKS